MIVRQAAPDKADFGDFFSKYVSGVEEIPWNDFLAHAGLMLEEKKGKAEALHRHHNRHIVPTGAGFLNRRRRVPQGQIAITSIAPDSPADEAGLDFGDVLIAMDGDRVDPASFNQRFAEKKIGSTIQLAVMRRDRLLTIAVPVAAAEPITYSIKEKPNATELERQIFTSWLAEKNFERWVIFFDATGFVGHVVDLFLARSVKFINLTPLRH